MEITFNVTMVTGAATDAIKVVFREGMTVIFLFAYLLWMNWMLTLVLIAILPVIGLMVTSASKKFRKQSKKIQTAMGDVTHVTSETISGFRVVRSFGGERYESDRFLKASTENRQRGLKMVRTFWRVMEAHSSRLSAIMQETQVAASRPCVPISRRMR